MGGYCWPCCGSSGGVIDNPTACLIALASASGRTEPWPEILYVEDNYGHVYEFTWDGSNQWSLPQYEPMTIQGPVNTCVGESRPTTITCFNDTISNRHGLAFQSQTSYPTPAGNSFFFQTTGTLLRYELGYDYDVIDISFSTLTRLVDQSGSPALCNPSDASPSGFTPTSLRMYENP